MPKGIYNKRAFITETLSAKVFRYCFSSGWRLFISIVWVWHCRLMIFQFFCGIMQSSKTGKMFLKGKICILKATLFILSMHEKFWRDFWQNDINLVFFLFRSVDATFGCHNRVGKRFLLLLIFDVGKCFPERSDEWLEKVSNQPTLLLLIPLSLLLQLTLILTKQKYL